jgi:hypothetical protein
MDMTYNGEKIIYIHYIDGLPHTVATRPMGGSVSFYQFEPDCKEVCQFMFKHDTSTINYSAMMPTPFFEEGAQLTNAYWSSQDVAFENGEPQNISKLATPLILSNNKINPFEVGRMVFRITYCRLCAKMVDILCEGMADDCEYRQS